MVSRLALAISSLALATGASSADWPQILGPQRNGVASEAEKIPLLFATGEPEIAWRYDLGSGFAGPAIAGGMVFAFHRIDDLAHLDALDATSGKRQWRFSYPTDYRDQFGFDNGPRAVPLVAGGRVYIYGAEGVVHAVDSGTGKQIWKRDLRADVNSDKGFFGRASSPLLIGGTLILQAGGAAGAGVIGLSAKDGSISWRASDHEGGYASGIIGGEGETEHAILFTRDGLLCIEPKRGRILIEKQHRAAINASVNAASPVAVGRNRVFLSACYEVGAAVWELNPKAGTVKPIWSAGEKLDCHYATPVPFSDHLIGFHGRQESGTQLRCVSAADGTLKWSSGRIAAGSLIRAGGTLLVLTERGELILAPASTEGFVPSARGQILGNGTRAMPALSGGRLYARDTRRLVCVKLR